MPKINGTYLALHRQVGRFRYPYYKGGLEFRETMNLSENFTKQDPQSSETYHLTSPRGGTEPELMEEIQGHFAGLVPDKALFFTESNSAHHITYFLAGETAKRLGKDVKLLVINFDQHEDHGTSSGAFFCGSWGSYIVDASRCDYLVVGPRGKITSYKFGEPGCETYKLSVDDLQRCLRERHSDCQQYYVTVDMDILENDKRIPRTNWGPGQVSCEALNELLNSLPAGKVTVADITGFPPVGSNVSDEYLQGLIPYTRDIGTIAATLCGLMGTCLYMPE